LRGGFNTGLGGVWRKKKRTVRSTFKKRIKIGEKSRGSLGSGRVHFLLLQGNNLQEKDNPGFPEGSEERRRLYLRKEIMEG